MAASLNNHEVFSKHEAILDIQNMFQQAIPQLMKKPKSAKAKKLTKKELNEISFQSKDDEDSSDEFKIDVNEVVRNLSDLTLNSDSGNESEKSGRSQPESQPMFVPLNDQLIVKLVEVLNEKSDDEIMKFRNTLRKMTKRQISETVQNSSVHAKKMKK